MEFINIQIPASVYCEIYKIHEEKTGQEIIKAIQKLATSSNEQRSYRPGSDTVTGKVWDIADNLKKSQGTTNRNEVVKACMAEEINVNTANTQYSQWAKENM